MSINYYPLDVRLLEKGTRLEVLEVEKITGKKYPSEAYALSLLQLKAKIERELNKIEKVLTLRISHGALIICTDAEAALYNVKQRRHAVRRIKRAHVKNMHVDLSKLSDEQKKEHERNLLYGGRMILAIKESKKLPLPKPCERNTPLLKSE